MPLVVSLLELGGISMGYTRWIYKCCLERIVSLSFLVAPLLLAFLFAPATADSPSDSKRAAFEVIDRNAEQIETVGDVLYYSGEPGMQEYESSKYLKETLERIGFKVEVGGAGLPTNVWATWGSGKPVIAIATEMDSLPEGSQTPGTIVVSIGPAEEQLMSRPYLVRDGYFKDVDAAILTHVADSSATGYGLQNYALIGAKFTFKGRTAHGGVNPWDGKDAVDAVVLMDIGFDKLREHLRPTYRGHRTITIGGVQPNIIPDVTWVVQSATVRFPVVVPGVQPHHWTAGITPTMSIAHKGAVVGAKVIAASVLDLLASTELRAAAKKQFEEDTKETKYFSLLPPGAKPPLDLNKEMMDKYRPAMRKFYLNKKAEFK